MADNTIDSLQLKISADAQSAEKSIARLADSLLRLQSSLKGITGGQFQNLSSGITELSNSMQQFSGSVKTADFTRIATGLNKLSSVNVQGVSDASRAINTLTANLSQIGSIAFDSQGIANVANAIAQLGRKTVTQATANIPALTTALSSLINGLNQIGTVKFDVTGLSELTSSISKLGGKSATTAASGNITKLATALKQMMTTLSSVPQVSQNLIQMTQALAQLASTGSRAGTATNTLIKSFNTLPSSTAKAKSGFSGLASAFGKFYATYWLFIRGMSQFKKAIDISSDLTEVQNVVDVSFGDMSDKMNEFADSALELYGMSELTAKQIGSRFQAMGVAMGFAQKDMTDMSIRLTQLAGDLASFYNISQDSAAQKLQSIFTGETEPMRQLGLDLSFATVEAWALAQGLDADMQSMTQAEKTMLRYQYVLANTGQAVGDYQRTISNWANQLRLLTGAFQELGSIVGGVLINAFKPFIQALNSVMGAVISFAETVSNALGAIFGWEYQTGGGVAQDLELGAGAAEEIEDATGGAADNAKKLNKYIAAWHEVNNMTTNDGTSGSGGGGGGGAGGTGGAGSGGQWVQSESLWEKYTSDIDSLYELGEYIGKVLTDAMNSIDWDSVYQGARNFGTGLANFLNGLISPDLFGAVGRTIAGALNTAIYAALAFGQTFDWADIGLSIATGINEFFKTFDFQSLAATINTWVQGIWKMIKTAFTNLDWKAILSGIGNFFSELDVETVALIIGTLTIRKIGNIIVGAHILKTLEKTLISKLTTAFANAFASINIGSFLVKLFTGNSVVGSLSGLSGASITQLLSKFILTPIMTFLTSTLPGAITGAITSLAAALGISVTAAGALVAGAVIAAIAGIVAIVLNWDEIKNFFTVTIPDFFTGTVIPFFQSIPEKIGEIWENLKTYTIEKWNGFISYMSVIPAKIGSILTDVWDWFNELPYKIGYAVGQALAQIVNWGIDIYDYLTVQIPMIISNVVTWFSELPGKIYNAIITFLENLASWGTQVFSSFKEWSTKTILNVVTWFSKLPGNVYDTIIKIKDKIVAWGNNTVTFFRTQVTKIVSKVTDFFRELPENMIGIGEDIIRGLWNGISNMVGWIGNKIKDFCSGILDGFRDGLDEHSPSKAAFEIGDLFTIGLGNGIVDRFSDIYDSIIGFGDRISNIGFSMPQIDVSVDRSKYQFSPTPINTGKLQTEMQESLSYMFGADGFIDYNRLGDAVYQAQSQALQENPVQIGDDDIFKATQRGQRRSYRRTGKIGFAGI